MKKLIIIAVVLISGCAAMSTTYHHPVTKQEFKCESMGFGWLGAPLAIISQIECKDKMEKAGWKTAPEVHQPVVEK